MFGIKDRLMKKLGCLILVVTIVPLVMVGYISFTLSKGMLERNEFDKLSAVRHIKEKDVIAFLKEKKADLSVLAHSAEILKAFDALQKYHDNGVGAERGVLATDTDTYAAFYAAILPFFRTYVDAYGYDDFYFLCAEHGHVMFSCEHRTDLGANLRYGSLKNSSLGHVWKIVHDTHKPVITDYSSYLPADDAPSLFIGQPVFQKDGSLLAVLALRIGVTSLDEIIQSRMGMGKTGKTYVVGQDFLMRNNIQLESGTTALRVRVDTPYVKKAFNGEEGTALVKNYKGTEVLSSYAVMNLQKAVGTDFAWAIVAEVDAREAFAPTRVLALKISFLVAIVLLLASIIAYFFSRHIALPLSELAEKARKMSKGDLTVSFPTLRRTDEVGILTRAFKELAQALREQTVRIIEGAGHLGSSISEISATSSELAANAAETSTSLAEITTTVEEVRQTSQVSSDKAEMMSKATGQMSLIADKGKKATQDVGSGMNRIKEEMEYVADSIVKLSEQTQNIGDIIDAVKDLADQSNLLSVNAAIEAAKAGEYGKGFAVVAQEVKALADQSKHATEQVKSILNDVQKATSAAVLATERGSKAVVAGAQLSALAGDSISVLSENVTHSANAVTQIAASNQQQQVGMDQLVVAMENINDTTMQNVEGARQLEEAMKNLSSLGQELRTLSEDFKV